MAGEDIAIGPGKADLLSAIAETGSIAAAGRRLDMSYRRAWLLVETMNRCFRAPLVEAAKGGARAAAPISPHSAPRCLSATGAWSRSPNWQSRTRSGRSGGG